MPILPKKIYEVKLPAMIKVKQHFPDEKLEVIPVAVAEEIMKENIKSRIPKGASVAVLVGSRGISNLKEIVKATVDCLLRLESHPFIVPAMGSHGGGVAEMQKEILEGYGITEEYIGVPIHSSMETVIIGNTEDDIPVHIDKIASEADIIIPIARVKVHTDFDAPIESGLCKMLAIGLGKHNGCSRLHQEGFREFPRIIPSVAKVILEKKYIGFGIAIIENAHENIHMVKAVSGLDFIEEEPKLLSVSKSLMPKLQFDEIDVLIIEQIGKDITGAGMDPNITGRMSVGPITDFKGPKIKRIVVLGLSEGTHRNATGVGIADFITRNVYDSIDQVSTYANCIASGNPEAGRIPIMLDTEEETILAALQTCPKIDITNPKIVRIKDTLHLIDIEVSENMLEYCSSHPSFIV
ncbi:lactate racemase domain-containing protein [Sinanaerobacter chloroacetimidivorans]|uniref:DUF2088 domain-containing protein n=1 Tax=Sinanaerobacter chloroacetimidivorans TaxID=2818044 RepID=A0A8J7VZA1_9FIRM|nr:lactate racemase domain-containing protein [Sinanaerobacter chloroacetimidivorans]MBR0597854.1 DUF2088 domain-containing protein [Sinanaerobacter chloroacetimidivorans]